MSTESEACLILKPEVSRDEFHVSAKRIGLIFSEAFPSDGDCLAYEEVWAMPSLERPVSAVNYVEDPLTNNNYLILRGNEVIGLSRKFAHNVATYSKDELIADAMKAVGHNEQVRAINRLALGFTVLDPAVFVILGTFATKAENSLTREAAINAIGFRWWPEFQNGLRIISERDPAENVRQKAKLVLAHWPLGNT